MTLVSPGVSVTVTDESFYASSGPGTVPLIFITTQENKSAPGSTSSAPGTLKENAGKLWYITSQRDLLQTFGSPTFYSVSGNQMHGYPLNEYGLLAAHSYLGISNRALVVRADVDTAQLVPLDTPPKGLPVDGTYWLDLNQSQLATQSALYEWDAANLEWASVEVYVVEKETDINTSGAFPTPKNVPAKYKYSMIAGRVVESATGAFILENMFYFKDVSGDWVQLDANYLNTLAINKNLQYKSVYPVTRPGGPALQQGDLWIDTRKVFAVVHKYDALSGQWISTKVPAFNTTAEANAFYGDNLRVGSMFVDYNFQDFANPIPGNVVFQHSIRRYVGGSSEVSVTLPVTDKSSSLFSITIKSREYGTQVFEQVVNEAFGVGETEADYVAAKLNTMFASVGFTSFVAQATGQVLKIADSADSTFAVTAATGLLDGLYDFSSVYSTWELLSYEAKSVAPTGSLAAGTLWYDSSYKIDILENDGLGAWVAPIGTLHVQSTEPATPIDGDLWVDTDQLDAYPVIYKRKAGAWKKVDNTDQTTPSGIVFADARPSNTGALDADAPDALMYPKGMLLWNSRYSSKNVKEWKTNYSFEGTLIGDRWVSKSGNDVDGSLIAGEAAVKKVVASAIAAAAVANQDIRSESVFFNLIAAPGFPEVIDEMVALNVDKKETAFIIGDTPFTLAANGTDIQTWASNANGAASNGDKGLITADEYLGVYYPSGLTTNLDGSEVVVPASHMVLRTMAYNDQVAYPWFAPAGYQRGVVQNATSVGYVDAEGEYVAVSLNGGLRDVLYSNNINAIYAAPNRGIVVYGQKTRSAVASALDRVNVARLINYVRYQADVAAQPFLFEPNDKSTRNSVKATFEALLGNLVSLRGLYDFVVQVDETNNTPDRIDRNELWVDIALKPTKAIEFIYIPIRIKNTGDSFTS